MAIAWRCVLRLTRVGLLQYFPGCRIISTHRGSPGLSALPCHVGIDGRLACVYVGTPGPTCKLVLTYFSADNIERIGPVVKCAVEVAAEQQISREAVLIGQVANRYGAIGPEWAVCHDSVSAQAYVSGRAPSWRGFVDRLSDLEFLTRVTSITSYKELIDRNRLGYGKDNRHAVVIDQFLARIASSDDIQTGLYHGDLAPWNMRCDEGRTRLVDWESASLEQPLGMDIIHAWLARHHGALRTEPFSLLTHSTLMEFAHVAPLAVMSVRELDSLLSYYCAYYLTTFVQTGEDNWYVESILHIATGLR